MSLWSRGQSSWLQIKRSGFDSRRYQIFWVVGLERTTLSLLSTTEELLESNSGSSGLETCKYGRRDPPRWPRETLYPQKLALTLPTSGSRSVGIGRSRTEATELLLLLSLSSDWQRRRKKLQMAVRNGIPHNHVDHHPFVIEARGICIPIGKVKCYLQQSTSPGHA
jgi:hypothetical protein